MSGYSSDEYNSGYPSDEYNSGDETGGQFSVLAKNRPFWTVSQPIIDSLKLQIKNLLSQIEPGIEITESNIDAVIAQKMTENGIEFNPNEPSLQNQYDKLTELKGKLEALQKKGGKIRKKQKIP
jgi:hypothetical protein